jgi:predicted amidohydrolase YtcJ
MRVACCPGIAALTHGVLGNLAAPAFASAAIPTDGPSPSPMGRSEPVPAVILHGGPILTVDDANPVGEALAIRGSKILGVGSLTEVKRHYTPATEIVDLEGHAVLPGFVEPHVHLLKGALATAADHAQAADPLDEETPGRVAELGARALRALAMRGCTTVYDTGIGLLAGAAEHELLRSLARAADVPVRIRGAFTPELAASLGVAPGAGDELYDVVGVAYWADGSILDFAAAVGAPYLNGHGDGTLNHEASELREGMRAWHRAGWQLVVHATGDRAIEQALDCYQALHEEGGPPRVRHRIEHFTVAREEQIARAAELGLGVSHTINEVYFSGERLREEVLGAERAARIHSLRRDLEYGVASSCHSDSPSFPADPCLALRTATTRLMRDSDDVLGPFQQLKLEEALRTVTSNAADHVLLGDRVGSLRPGMLADLVVLDRDPREVPPERLHELRVLETWLGGRRQRWG